MVYFYLFSESKAQKISLANQAQFLLINTTSVDWLIQKVDEWDTTTESPLDRLQGAVDRFRGNLIIQSPTALEELAWTQVNIGMVMLKAGGPCTRCQMICIDQRTGDKTTEPLRTISREFQGKVKFGIYFGHSASEDNSELYIDCDDDVYVTYKK